jgi:two-component system sensor histidine kinase RpfC
LDQDLEMHTAVLGELAHSVWIQPDSTRTLVDQRLRRHFVSTLPLHFTREEAKTARLAAAAQHGWSKAAGVPEQDYALPVAARGLKILLADDNRTNRLVVSKILERGGHVVHAVNNGETALDALDEGAFDVLIMDVNMPVMTGLEAAKLIRFGEVDGSRLPIIALTADATTEMAERTSEAGMDVCLTKPVQPTVLLRKVEEVTAKAQSIAQSSPAHQGTPPLVMGISAHPEAQVGPGPCLDDKILLGLESLGGPEFLLGLIEEFSEDARLLIAELQQSVTEANAHEFRNSLHALQSASANIGARAVHRLCLDWRKISNADLALDGAERVDLLARELVQASEALRRHCAARTPPAANREAGIGANALH